MLLVRCNGDTRTSPLSATLPCWGPNPHGGGQILLGRQARNPDQIPAKRNRHTHTCTPYAHTLALLETRGWKTLSRTPVPGAGARNREQDREGAPRSARSAQGFLDKENGTSSGAMVRQPPRAPGRGRKKQSSLDGETLSGVVWDLRREESHVPPDYLSLTVPQEATKNREPEGRTLRNHWLPDHSQAPTWANPRRLFLAFSEKGKSLGRKIRDIAEPLRP